MGSVMSNRSAGTNIDDEDVFPVGDADIVLDDLLIDILVHISPTDLLKCRLVCKAWKELIDGHSLWKSKCERENKFIPSVRFEKLPENYYRKIYLHDPYRKNLIYNPCGEDGLRFWLVSPNVGDGWAIEKPPAGANPVPSEVGSQSCFSTTFFRCEKHQLIDLYNEGVSKEVLLLKGTKIQISEWYAARFDCASEYNLTVTLLKEGLDQYYKYYDKEVNHFYNDDYIRFTVDEFDFHFEEIQWAGKEWHKVSHTFENVGDVRYVAFKHNGKDKQFWSGNYGIKMTGASVRIIV